MAGIDTFFRVPLYQRISTKGAVAAPPDTMWTKVIFYDVLSEKSNPDFESPPWGVGGASPHINMVRSDKMRFTTAGAVYFGLDSIGKPIGTANKDSVFFSCCTDRWFNEWKPNAIENKTVPRANPGDKNDCDAITTLSDTFYTNILVYDSIPSTHRFEMGSNAYSFSRTGGPYDLGFF